jgi:hypothetical protein
MGFNLTTGVYTPPNGATNAFPGQIIASATWNAIHTDISAALTQLGQQQVIPRPVSVTGAASLATTASGALVALSGGTLFTFTVGAASGFSPNFSCVIFNADTGRGKALAINGLTSFVLWPLQFVVLYNVANAWATAPLAARWPVPAGTVFNVDNVNGSDAATNDGLGAQGTSGAFLTVQHAYSVIQKQLLQTGAGISIQLPPTTSTPIVENLAIAGAMPSGIPTTTIIGNPTTPTNCKWQPTAGISVDDYQSVTFDGVGFSASSGQAFVTVTQFGLADFENCDFGANPGGINFQFAQNSRSNFLTGNTISGSCAGFVQSVENASVTLGASFAVVGTPNVGVFADALRGGTINLAGLAFTGAGTISGQKFTAHNGGIIIGDIGPTWPVGFTAGTSTNGGIADANSTSFALLGVGVNPAATMFLRLAAGTTTIAQINFGASTAPTSPNDGDMWFDGSNLKIRISGTTKTFTVT